MIGGFITICQNLTIGKGYWVQWMPSTIKRKKSPNAGLGRGLRGSLGNFMPMSELPYVLSKSWPGPYFLAVILPDNQLTDVATLSNSSFWR